MNKSLKIGFFILLAAILGIGGYIVYVFTKAPESATNMKPEIVIKASEFFTSYEEDEEASNKLYLDKLIQVEGRIAEIFSNNSGDLNIILKEDDDFSGISCSFIPQEQEKVKKLNTGDVVKIKGFCSGMLMDVVLNRCVLVE
ncbi:MAG: hypothetical protein JXB49_20880 [Bacteroidales bacterium]|nr:hypothetical protein [Bacteroidales bacterium]